MCVTFGPLRVSDSTDCVTGRVQAKIKGNVVADDAFLFLSCGAIDVHFRFQNVQSPESGMIK